MNKTSKLACFFLQSLFREDKVLLFAFPGLTTFLILTNLPVYSEPPRATTFGRLTTVAGTLNMVFHESSDFHKCLNFVVEKSSDFVFCESFKYFKCPLTGSATKKYSATRALFRFVH